MKTMSLIVRYRGSLCSHYPRFGGKAPNRIEPMDVIYRTRLHVRRIFASAQCRRDALHHRRRNAANMTRGSTMHMTAENGDHPPGLLQSLAQPRRHLRRLEVQPLRPHRYFKRRMMGENRNRFGPGIDELIQPLHPLGAKVTLVAD